MWCTNHAIAFVPGHSHPIFSYFQLRCPIVQGKQNGVWCQRAVQPSRYWFARPIRTFIEFLAERRMRIRLSQNVAVAIFVEWMLQRITMGWQFHVRCYIGTGTTFLASWPLFTTGQFALIGSALSQTCCNENCNPFIIASIVFEMIIEQTKLHSPYTQLNIPCALSPAADIYLFIFCRNYPRPDDNIFIQWAIHIHRNVSAFGCVNQCCR